jgi:hypothetical protein
MSTRIKTGTKNKAPEYISSSKGTPLWSGVTESEFTKKMENDLNQFIQLEANLQGWNDRNNNRVDCSKSIFHPKFMNGAAHKMWLEHYEKGVAEYEKQHTKETK